MVSLEFFVDIILPAVLWPSERLRTTQSLTEMSSRDISIGGRCLGLTNLPPSCGDYHEIWEPQPPGTLRACTGIALLLNVTLQFRSQTKRFSFLRSETQELGCPTEGAISTPVTRTGCESRPFRSV
jgi:hypothetical protein